MFCTRCNTPFVIQPLEEGKSKYCENCGQAIYKMENGVITTFSVEEVFVKQDIEIELRERINREKETRFREQLERKEKEKEFRERLEQERLIREKEELERKLKEKEEQDRLFQLQLEEEKRLKERLLQIQQEKDRMELERYENELAEREQKLREQIIKEEEEKVLKIVAEKDLAYQSRLEAEKRERERLENELAIFEKQRIALEEKLALEKKHFELAEKVRIAQEQERLSFLEKERKIKENLLLAQLENERLERERLERDLLQNKTPKVEAVKQALTIPEINPVIPPANNSTIQSEVYAVSSKQNRIWWVVPVLIIAAALCIFYYVNRADKKTTTKTVVTESAASVLNVSSLNSDQPFLQQLKSTLDGKEILSWNPVKESDIKDITLLSGEQNAAVKHYIAALNLEDNSGTKANAEIKLSYNNNILSAVEIQKITYKNIAPVRAWFSFAPVPNCSISINTNNNPIQLKTCDDCAIQKLVSDAGNPVLVQSATKISIKSDNRYEAVVEFSYVPVK